MKELELKSGFSRTTFGWDLLGSSIERAENYPLDLSPYADYKKVLVSCGTQLAWAKDNLLYQTQQLAEAHPDCHFCDSGGLADKTSNVKSSWTMFLWYLIFPIEEYIPQMDYDSSWRCGHFYQCIIYGKPALILPHTMISMTMRFVWLRRDYPTAKREDTEAIGRFMSCWIEMMVRT